MGRSTFVMRVFACSFAIVASALASEVTTLPNALVPGVLRVTPTIECAGVFWAINGDANRNAVSEMEFREEGSETWWKAMPMWRMFPQAVDVANSTVGGFKVDMLGGPAKWKKDKRDYLIDHYSRNYFAGSIFHLSPGTKYEARVTLTDPDGGGVSRTISFATREAPVIAGQTHNIIDVSGGGNALAKAVAKAAAGDLFRVHAGKYDAFVINASGTSENPICIVSARDGEVEIAGDWPAKVHKPGGSDHSPRADDGIIVNGSHVWIEGLSVKGFAVGIKVGSRKAAGDLDDTAVMHCTITGCYDALLAAGKNGYYADNTVTGIHLPLGKVADPQIEDDVTEGHGIVVEGDDATGNVVCYNTVTRVADMYRAHCPDSDVYGNDGIFCSDDAIELDDGGANLRVWGNRWLYCGNNGISFQPYIGGPCYLIRNIVANFGENATKVRYKSSGAIFINNTLLSGGDVRKGTVDLVEQMYTRNNLFLTNQKIAIRYQYQDFLRQPHTLDMDYDGVNGIFQADRGVPPDLKEHLRLRNLAQFQTDFGLEKHGITVTLTNCFADHVPTIEEGNQAMATYNGPIPSFILAKNSPAIGRGVILPNVTEPVEGKMPDLGAIESGGPPPHWGPRPPGR